MSDAPRITSGPSAGPPKDTAESKTAKQFSKPTTADTGTSTTPTQSFTADASTSTDPSDLDSKSEEQQQKSLWEQLLEAFKKFLNLQPQNSNQNIEEQKKRQKEEEEEEERKRRLLVRSLSSIFIEFNNLNQTSSNVSNSEWKMPGYMEHGFVGPNSEIKAFAEYFSQNNLANSLDTFDSPDFSKAKDFLTGIKDFATSNVSSNQSRPSSPGSSSR